MIEKNHWRQPETLALLLILFLAFLLRFYGNWFGLPFLLHDDEPNEVLRALQLGTGSYNLERIGKGGYFYLLFVEYGLLFFVLKIVGVVSTATDFAKLYILDPTAFYMIGRTTTAVIGVINVALIYKIGRLAYSPIAGLAGAALLAVNILHAQISHYVTVDVPMVCLSTGSLYFATKMLFERTSRNYYLAAMLAALAMSTKLSAALLVIPLAVAHACHVSNCDTRKRRYFLDSRLWIAVLVFIGVYVVTTPGILFYFKGVALFILSGIGLVSVDGGESVGLGDVRDVAFANMNLYQYYATKIIGSMTLPVFAICAMGIAWGIWRRKQADLILISFALAVYVVAAMTSNVELFYARYILPAIPVLAILGGRFLTEFITSTVRAKKVMAVAVSVFALAIIPVYRIALADMRLLYPDTRIITHEWFAQHVPDSSIIFIEGAVVRPTESTVPLQYSRSNIIEGIEYFLADQPGKAKYFELELQILEGKTYDLVTVDAHELETLQYYKNTGIQYFVVRPEAYGLSTRRYMWSTFVSEIRHDSEIQLLNRIAPNDASVRGPTIEVYGLIDMRSTDR